MEMPASSLDDLPEVEAEWTTRASEDLWRLLSEAYNRARATGSSDETESDTEDAIVLGPVLGTSREPRVAQCAVVKLDGNLYWQLTVSTPPDEPTPEEVTKISQTLGGQEGLHQFLKEAVTGTKVGSVSYDISFQLRESVWRCRVLPSTLREVDQSALAGLVPEARIEHVGYRAQSGAEGIRDLFVSYDHQESRFLVNAVAADTLELSDGQWLPRASAIARRIAGKLFERSGGSHAAEP